MSSAGLETKTDGCAGTAEIHHGTDYIQVKQEEEEEEQEEEEEDDQEEKQEQVEGQQGRGKRKLGSMAKALCRNSAWTVSSRQPDRAERASSKRQQIVFASGAGGVGTAATHETSGTTARCYGRRNRFCLEHGCTLRSSYGKAGSIQKEFCSQHAQKDMVNVRLVYRGEFY